MEHWMEFDDLCIEHSAWNSSLIIVKPLKDFYKIPIIF